MNHSELKDHLYELESRLINPDTRQSPSELDQLLASDFFEFGSSGNVWYKKDAVGDNGLSVRDMSMTDFQMHVLSDETALVTYRVIDETRKQHTLRSSIWKRIDNRWQMFFHQGTITGTQS